IEHPGSFRLYARLRGLAGSLKSGVYLLRQDESWSDVVAALERGRGLEQRFTVREGLRLAEVADLARAQLKIPRDSFLAAAEDSSLLVSVGVPAEAPSAEGYLFPTTYLLPLGIGARELVRVMTHQFTQQWSPEWQARLDSLHFSRHELVTLASIVEAEVRYDPDRPFVSAVYHNRLKRGMRLEADPTVSYAYGRRLRRVWEKNLAVRSPYNTYLHAGLPPGPIGQPGRAGLLAALYPATCRSCTSWRSPTASTSSRPPTPSTWPPSSASSNCGAQRARRSARVGSPLSPHRADDRDPGRPGPHDGGRVGHGNTADPDHRRTGGGELRESPESLGPERRAGIGLVRRGEAGTDAPVVRGPRASPLRLGR